MNLKTCFHIKYIFENLKKSKALLALLLFLFPLIMSLIQILTKTYGVIDLLSENILSILAMFIIPVLLSMILFSFLYKRKKVDFIIGMPLSRKQIFISNTIAGIVIIILIFLINVFFLFLFSCFAENTFLYWPLVFDYLLFYILGYILVFTAANLAMTIVGNVMTQIVVTLLLLFFIPFCTLYYQGINQTETRIVELKCNNNECQEILQDRCEEFTGIKN